MIWWTIVWWYEYRIHMIWFCCSGVRVWECMKRESLGESVAQFREILRASKVGWTQFGSGDRTCEDQTIDACHGLMRKRTMSHTNSIDLIETDWEYFAKIRYLISLISHVGYVLIMQPENSHHLILHVVGLGRSLWCTGIVGYRPAAQCIVQNTTLPARARIGRARCIEVYTLNYRFVNFSTLSKHFSFQFLSLLEALQGNVFSCASLPQVLVFSMVYRKHVFIFFLLQCFVVCRIAAQLPRCHCLREHFILRCHQKEGQKFPKKFVALSWWICQGWRNHRQATWTPVINYLCLQV